MEPNLAKTLFPLTELNKTGYTRSSFIFRGGLLVSGNLSVSDGTRYAYCSEQPQKFLVIQLYN